MKKRTALTTAKSSVALLLFTLPLSSNLAYSAPSTTGEGNIVTGDHGVATGYNNAVTAKYGLAQGNDSVATGGNISRKEFDEKLNEGKQTIANKSKAENELSDINKKIEASNKTAEDLNKRINEITDLIKQSNDKKNQVVTSLNNDLANKKKELAKLDKEREEAKEYASHYPSIYSEDESVSIKFLKQLKELDWNKLSDNSAGTTGVQKLAKDLKERVEADYPNVSAIKKFGIDKYEVIVNGYDNARGSFEYNKKNIEDMIKSRNQQYLFYTGAGRDLSSYASDHDGITDLLKNVTSVDPVKITSIDNIPSRITDDFFSSQKQERYVQFSTLLKMISENNVISDLSKAYKLDKINSQNYYKPNYVANTVFYLPPIKASDDQINHSDFLLTSHKYHSGDFDYLGYDENNKKVEFRFEDKDKAKHYLYYGQTQRFFDEFFDGEKTNTPQDVKRLREWVNRFYNDFDNLIDREAPEEKWLFDKQDFLNQLKDVESFAKKISDYIAVYDEANKSPTPENRAKRNSLYEEISKLKNDSKNYYENIKFKFKESTKNLWNEYAKKTATELTDWAKKLKLYEPYNDVVKGITEESEKAQKALDDAQIKFEKMEEEIKNLTSQIENLKSTSDSQNSNELKQKQEELAKKQVEKEELEKERAKKEKALKELEEKLTRHFSNIGENSIAAGKESFASGTNSIAIGTKNEVTGNNSVAIGAGNKVASHNVMVLGNNVTVDAGFDGAVVLGNESAPSKPMPVESITIQGTTYRFAGTNPTSTVSVGAEGKERQITHVAAGRITSTSTDAINGSQLYSVVEAINQKVTQHNKMLKAGIAGSAAIAGLPQVRGNGKSMISAGAGNFKGQNAIAVGYSRSSDNGKVLFRLSGSTNTQGDVVSSVGVGYEW
ncbi:MAG: YadA-like family protein [Haemophilus parainfluenzae]|nr:YadA-like family protein [Haemophilus parainfluenzae]